ncbi:MAG: four-helix bundle copper-binding protein [Balneolales bacterium]
MPHEKYQECIDACNQCAVTCEHCASSCLQEDNVSDLARCIALDHNCADICLLASKLMSNGSEFSGKFCAMCADVCETCGKECEKHSSMGHCRDCAEACFQCAKVCREMAETAVS